ncbi:hypothetical protein Dxin01_03393 [Deinococcus xinjiangensis]|uniref:Uncharacterized protein n=1 Tax=Deinococcus xinjiangensis TaxID=457454 RepID=A0ABP9VEH3_9DEIO
MTLSLYGVLLTVTGLLMGQAVAISANEARTIAVRIVGGNVLSVSALITKNGDFVAALTNPYAGGDVTLTLLQKAGSVYTRLESQSLGEAGNQVDPEVWLSDANKDGFPEMIWYRGEFGNVVGAEYYTFYDTRSKKKFTSTISRVFQGPGKDSVEYDPELLAPDNKLFLAEVVRRVEANPAFPKNDVSDPYNDMVEQWNNKYGSINAGRTGYLYAPPVKALAANCAVNTSTITTLKVGTTTYISQFKDGVYARDSRTGGCTLVYYPKTMYDWVGKISLARGWIMMVNRNNPKDAVYYDPKGQTLTRKAP